MEEDSDEEIDLNVVPEEEEEEYSTPFMGTSETIIPFASSVSQRPINTFTTTRRLPPVTTSFTPQQVQSLFLFPQSFSQFQGLPMLSLSENVFSNPFETQQQITTDIANRLDKMRNQYVPFYENAIPPLERLRNAPVYWTATPNERARLQYLITTLNNSIYRLLPQLIEGQEISNKLSLNENLTDNDFERGKEWLDITRDTERQYKSDRNRFNTYVNPKSSTQSRHTREQFE
jgi:hypothetical protein